MVSGLPTPAPTLPASLSATPQSSVTPPTSASTMPVLLYHCVPAFPAVLVRKTIATVKFALPASDWLAILSWSLLPSKWTTALPLIWLVRYVGRLAAVDWVAVPVPVTAAQDETVAPLARPSDGAYQRASRSVTGAVPPPS